MPAIIPMTADGDRIVTVDTGGGVYSFRSYYAAGFENRWLLDIYDAAGGLLLAGITVADGSANILKGQGAQFESARLAAVLLAGDIGGEEALGETLQLLWFNEGEEDYFSALDPMEGIKTAKWAGKTENYQGRYVLQDTQR